MKKLGEVDARQKESINTIGSKQRTNNPETPTGPADRSHPSLELYSLVLDEHQHYRIGFNALVLFSREALVSRAPRLVMPAARGLFLLKPKMAGARVLLDAVPRRAVLCCLLPLSPDVV